MSKDPYRYYRPEAGELLEELGKGILEMEKLGAAKEKVARLLRLAHTLKGAARVVRHGVVADMAHAFEDVLGPFRDQPGPVAAAKVTELWQLVDGMTQELAKLAAAAVAAPSSPAAGPTGASVSPSRKQVRPSGSSGKATRPASAPTQASLPAAPQAPTAAATPVAARAGGPTAPLPEERFETVRVELAEMDALLAGVSQVAVQAAALRRQVAGLGDAERLAASAIELLTPSVRTQRGAGAGAADLARASALLEELRAVVVTAGRGLSARLDRSEAELRQLQARATTLRLLPAGSVFSTLERAAREVAQMTGKSIEVATSGGEHRLDGLVLGPLREALLHVVRNAVDHGIESPAERIAARKSERGWVRLAAERRGGKVAFICKDDGRGLDLAGIRRAAVARGVVTTAQADALDAAATVELMLRGGLTTARAVTEISGRGIGLDVVREVAARLKGTVRVESAPGQGTTFELEVPLSLASIDALMVEAGGAIVWVPLGAVRQSLRLAPTDIAQTAEGSAIVFQGQVVPFLPLASALGTAAFGAPEGRRHALPASQAQSVLVLESRRGWVALGALRIVGTAEIVVRPLPAVVGPVSMVAGVTFDAEGDPQLILDPDGLVDAARTGQGRVQTSSAPPRPRILVIDDSLTTRMLEQSILESAGYEVDLAVSGEEAMEKARAARYGVFVVDVEMPGMDGFEFVRRTRADATLRETPAILVTSLSTPEHKRRGLEAGARAYIIKGEFDQGHFLTTIRGLMG